MKNLLEIPSASSFDFNELASNAASAAETIKIPEIVEGRRLVEGVSFVDSDDITTISMDARESGSGYEVNFHIPHTSALAPVGSDLDKLLRYGYVYFHWPSHRLADELVFQHFQEDAETWPSLTVTVPIEEEHGNLLVGKPREVGRTACTPSLVVSDEVKKQLNDPGAKIPDPIDTLLVLATRLSGQRFEHGAYEVYHDDQPWVWNDKLDKFVPLSTATFIRRELQRAVAQSIAEWFVVGQIPGLFLARPDPKNLDVAETHRQVEQYFESDLAADALLRYILAIQGPKIKAGPSEGIKLGRNPEVRIGNGRIGYDKLINTRQVEHAFLGEQTYGAQEVFSTVPYIKKIDAALARQRYRGYPPRNKYTAKYHQMPD